MTTKRNKRAGAKAKPESKAKPQSKETSKFWSLFMLALSNLIVGMLFIFIFYFSYQKVPGYKWITEKTKKNFEFIRKNPDFPIDSKKETKLGFEYKYLNHLNQNTPEDAVILFPFSEQHFENKELKIHGYKNPRLTIMRKQYIASFLYPRKAVFLKDRDVDSNFSRLTHLAIIDYMGYELIPNAKRNLQHGLMTLNMNGKK